MEYKLNATQLISVLKHFDKLQDDLVVYITLNEELQEVGITKSELLPTDLEGTSLLGLTYLKNITPHLHELTNKLNAGEISFNEATMKISIIINSVLFTTKEEFAWN